MISIVQIGETLILDQNIWDSSKWPEPDLYRPFVLSCLQKYKANWIQSLLELFQ